MFIINISATLGHTFKALFYFSNAINVIQELYNSGHLNTLSSVTRKKERKGAVCFLKRRGGGKGASKATVELKTLKIRVSRLIN